MTEKKQLTNQTQLLQKWLNRKDKPQREEKLAIQKMPTNIPLPTSFGQKQLWVMQQLYPNSRANQHSEVATLHGNLSVEKLKTAFQAVLQKHLTLRTSYQLIDNQLIQTVINSPISIPHYDLRSIQDIESHHQKILNYSQELFEISSNFPVRMAIFQLEDHHFKIVIVFHHIAIDALSVPIFWHELTTAYNGVPLTETVLQYADYAYWQQKLANFNTELAFWQKKLANLKPIILNTDFQRPSKQTFDGAQESLQLPTNLFNSLRNLAKETSTTLYMVFATAFKTLLALKTGQTDISFGSPMTLRNQKELDQLIGFFDNILVWRTDFSGNPSFSDSLQRVKATAKEVMAHHTLPFEKLVGSMQLQRVANLNPLFQTMFVYKHNSQLSVNLDGNKLDIKGVDLKVSKFDISLFILEKDDSAIALFEYNTNLFKANTVKNLLNDLLFILQTAVTNPNASILDNGEKLPTSVIKEKNRTATSIHDLIAKHAITKVNQEAVCFKDESLTYSELNSKANTLATYLITKGIKTNSRIGLLLDRSLNMMVGILGILKAGLAYIPIDPTYPQDRIQFILTDAQVEYVVTAQHLADSLPSVQSEIILIEQIPQQLSPVTFPKVKGSDLAYIIYTSGSTGQPKGVPITHQNFSYSNEARVSYYPTMPQSFLLMSSFAFDSSMVGLFWPLITGGKVIITEHRAEQDMKKLSELIATHQVTHTLMLPSLYELLLKSGYANNLKSLNTVIVAGEECFPSLGELHYQLLPKATLYNEYGPTEATVWCSVYPIQATDRNQIVPIGKPIEGTTFHILDHNLKPVSQGDEGELYIGGPGVCQGYLHRPKLTTDRFIPNPLSANETTKVLYKTGDLTRLRIDGEFEFLGRVDQQVKIHGYRIELGEIKEKLKELPQIEDVAVIIQSETMTTINYDDDTLIELLNSLSPEKVESILKSIEQAD